MTTASACPGYDIFGDLHGCLPEWLLLLKKLGYAEYEGTWRHPAGRRIVLVGDLTDRGPDSPGVLSLAMHLYAEGQLLAVCGNHDDKLRRALLGHRVLARSGLDGTLAALAQRPAAFTARVIAFLTALPFQLPLDEGRLLVVHAGIRADLIGRTDKQAKAFCLYGETTGKLLTDGHYERLDWTRNYDGAPFVVYGHDAKLTPYRNRRTIDIDTGCVFGNRLTAYRYPEDETVQVAARRVYSSAKPRLITSTPAPE